MKQGRLNQEGESTLGWKHIEYTHEADKHQICIPPTDKKKRKRIHNLGEKDISDDIYKYRKNSS